MICRADFLDFFFGTGAHSVPDLTLVRRLDVDRHDELEERFAYGFTDRPQSLSVPRPGRETPI